MHARPEFPLILDQILNRQSLIRKAHIHHAGGMSFRRGEVDQTAFAENDDSRPASPLKLIFLHKWPERMMSKIFH